MADTLSEMDTKLSSGVEFIIGDPELAKIIFQFPPKILTDNRTGSWDEVELMGDQPVSIYKGSGARKFTLEWVYVIGAAGWDTNKVREQITTLRSYYTKSSNSLLKGFIVKFKMWKFGGNNPMTCRLGNIDISHGKALFVQDGDITMAHPVITTIKVAMQPWINGGSEGMKRVSDKYTQKKDESTNTDFNVSKIDVKQLESVIPIEWQ
jgi:hypothetical protein